MCWWVAGARPQPLGGAPVRVASEEVELVITMQTCIGELGAEGAGRQSS